jgi:D-beta-D-heptose 7-phosphate kinase/D-beta-D-heptose 1-phosphate adenosyltransferase
MTLPWTNKKITVAVVGDIILDEYIEGSVNRISPEAPVPVLLVSGTKLVPGGAANVARNIQLAGGNATLFGIVGRDQAASDLKRILMKDGVDVSPVIGDNTVHTIRKTRVTADRHQLVRIDWESVKPISTRLQEILYEELRMSPWDVLLISDYAKGGIPHPLIRRLIPLARSRSALVIVDPKGKDYSPYEGASLITPNRKEAQEAIASLKSDSDIAHSLMNSFKFDNVLVTLGADGMLGLDSNKELRHMPTVALDVFDVSGAGDTVAAIMALSMGSGLDLFEAMKLANLAAGKVVGKWGTQPILMSELESASKLNIISNPKIVTFDQVTKALESVKPGRIVFTNGCFDILHAGHVSYLEKARKMGSSDPIIIRSNDNVVSAGLCRHGCIIQRRYADQAHRSRETRHSRKRQRLRRALNSWSGSCQVLWGISCYGRPSGRHIYISDHIEDKV